MQCIFKLDDASVSVVCVVLCNHALTSRFRNVYALTSGDDACAAT